MRLSRPLPLILSVALAGCMAVPRPAPAPVAGATADWIAPVPGAVADRWWQALGDPALDDLVAAALKANPDIAEAAAHLVSAREAARAVGGAALPQVSATASATRSRQTLDGEIPVYRIPGFERDTTLYDAGFDASWELDFWGGARSAVAAAKARAGSVAAQAAGARLQVVAEVVREYAVLRSAQARRGSVLAEAQLQSRLVALHRQRLNAGEAARDPLVVAEQRLAVLQSEVPGLGAQIRAAAYALGVLTARAPETMVALADTAAPAPRAPPVVALGLRSDVLRRRPDVLGSEADLAAYTAQIGVARAALFPHITLSGTIGQQALAGLDLTSPASTRFSAGPSLSWPIFAGGQLRAQLRGAKADARAAADRYEKAVLNALADSETAANRFTNAQAAEAQQAAALQLAGAAAQLSGQLQARGEDSMLDNLQVAAAEEEARQAQLAASANTLDAYVSLCKALGGGIAD